MFDFKATAEVKNLNVRSEIHGDETVPAIDVKLMCMNVPVDKITSACVGIGDRFYDGNRVAVGEVNPLTVSHKLENLTVTLGDSDNAVTMKGVTIKKSMKINLQPDKVADVLLTIQTQHHDQLAIDIMGMLREEVPVQIGERQLKLAEMEQ